MLVFDRKASLEDESGGTKALITAIRSSLPVPWVTGRARFTATEVIASRKAWRAAYASQPFFWYLATIPQYEGSGEKGAVHARE